MTPFIISIILILFTSTTTSRRILHQPFFPATDPPPPPSPPPPQTTTQPPSPSPQPSPSPLPKQPFSSITTPTTTPTHHHNNHDHHFFPLFTTPPSSITTTTTTTTTTLPTFPANFTLPYQTPSSKPPHSVSKRLMFLLVPLLSIVLVSTMVLAIFLYHHRTTSTTTCNNLKRQQQQDDNDKNLLPPNHPTSDNPRPPPSFPPNYSSTPSTELLYLGTLFSPMHSHANVSSNANDDVIMGSPELHPLPPLVRKVQEKVVMAAPPLPEVAAGGGGGGVKMKGLYWDKVRGRSDKAMVWDQFKFSSSFRVNEEMMETLFVANSSKPALNRRTMAQPVSASMNQKIRVLDPHKSRNIAILLRAFNLTIDEVCESILQGNVDTLGSELLGSLLKMTPTVDEEIRLKELNDTLLVELDPAEKFLKAVTDIPFAFKRVDAMLYISNFDTEVEYLKASFETIKSACRELKNSRMFIRLLEAVLMAGNRMNIGTNRGDAQAFKLDTLLKLIDIKGTDGKTTLLHFVVHEITKAEAHLSGFNQKPELYNEVESTKRGLEMVSRLGGELSSVKKAAAIDYDILSNEVTKLAMGLTKIREVVALNEPSGSNDRFLDSMTMFLRKAEADIVQIKDEERVTILTVNDITEYFHGTLTMEEENQPLWIFIVVRDFLLVLDRVCKEVGKINERTTVGSQSLPPSVFPSFNGRRGFSSF